MEGCPHCSDIKTKLHERGVPFDERKINEHEKEYKQFVSATDNEYLPAMTFVEINEDNDPVVELHAPDDSFDTIEEAVSKAEKFLLK